MATPQVIVIVPPELADGYRLAGVHAEVADSATAAGRLLNQALGGAERPGVVAMYPHTSAGWASAGSGGSPSWTKFSSSRFPTAARTVASRPTAAKACGTCWPAPWATSSPSALSGAPDEHPVRATQS
jgi:hypothetical protein